MTLKRMIKTFTIAVVVMITAAFTKGDGTERIHMPYKKAGLTRREAAAHLLNRFSFGIQPGQVDEVVRMGLENWLRQQLEANLPDDEVVSRLAGYDALTLNNETIVNTYLTPAQVLRMGVRKQVISKDSINKSEREDYRAQLKKIQEEEGYRPVRELHRQLISQKTIRAAYSRNQLREVLTDFWFNHFNVSLTKNQCQQFVLGYERDAIRPYVLADFKSILQATARHPAMLLYLDNAISVSNNNERARRLANSAQVQRFKERMEALANDTAAGGSKMALKKLNAAKMQGLNENYARELMELHTLGVDGGYTQQDVTELARALTGWGIKPLYKEGPAAKLLENLAPEQLQKRGYVTEGDFLFRSDKHDDSAKTILGKPFPANGGYDEGVQVLDMLANHPSTAKFIATKLATRFVSDQPPAAIIHKMTTTFLQTKGDIRAVIITMVNSTEFWSKEVLREKVKSPFDLAISAIRATGADVLQPYQVYNWCAKMGQRFYYYQAPTGFPDKGSYWINTGSLLNRMNFGLAFATQKIPGIELNLAALNNNHAPGSTDDALRVYSRLLLPERNGKEEENIKRLTALAQDHHPANTISHVAGIIIGSPEFQRK